MVSSGITRKKTAIRDDQSVNSIKSRKLFRQKTIKIKAPPQQPPVRKAKRIILTREELEGPSVKVFGRGTNFVAVNSKFQSDLNSLKHEIQDANQVNYCDDVTPGELWVKVYNEVLSSKPALV